jgi:Domain of unknown function (DUF4168)
MPSQDRRSALHRPLVLSAIATAIGVASLSFLSPVSAQTPAPSQVQKQPAAPDVPNQKPIPNEKITAAASAMEHVASLRQNYQQQLAAAPPDQQQRIAGEGTEALSKAVTDQGLSIDEYNSILTAAQSDPKVRDQLLQHMHSPSP